MFDNIWHKFLKRPYHLHVEDHGGAGPVIILLHGLASSSANWQYLTPLLKAHYHCISIDLLGFGASPKPQWSSYSLEDHVAALRHTIKRHGIVRPHSLLGHSLGSLLATRYARQYSRDIEGLILLSPPVYDAVSAKRRTTFYLAAYRFLRTHKRLTPTNMARLSKLLPKKSFLSITASTWIPFIRSLEQCIENQTIQADLRQVAAPTDIFYGTFDEVVIAQNVRQLAKIKEVNLHQLGVSHIVGKRYAAAVAKALTAQVER